MTLTVILLFSYLLCCLFAATSGSEATADIRALLDRHLSGSTSLPVLEDPSAIPKETIAHVDSVAKKYIEMSYMYGVDSPIVKGLLENMTQDDTFMTNYPKLNTLFGLNLPSIETIFTPVTQTGSQYSDEEFSIDDVATGSTMPVGCSEWETDAVRRLQTGEIHQMEDEHRMERGLVETHSMADSTVYNNWLQDTYKVSYYIEENTQRVLCRPPPNYLVNPAKCQESTGVQFSNGYCSGCYSRSGCSGYTTCSAGNTVKFIHSGTTQPTCVPCIAGSTQITTTGWPSSYKVTKPSWASNTVVLCDYCSPGQYNPDKGSVGSSACKKCPAMTWRNGAHMGVEKSYYNNLPATSSNSYGGFSFSQEGFITPGTTPTSYTKNGNTFYVVTGSNVDTNFFNTWYYNPEYYEVWKGSVFDVEAPSSCYPCTAGTWAAAGASKCTAGCPAGQELSGSKCTKCAAGKFKSYGGTGSCSSCSHGTYSLAGATGCTACNPGYYANVYGMSACLQCTTGTIASAYAKSVCTSCVAGKYQSNAGQSACMTCDGGYVAKTAGLSVCTGCGTGKYSNSDRNSCVQCAAGKSSDANSNDESDCQWCAAGKYAPLNAATCTQCEAGKQTPLKSYTNSYGNTETNRKEVQVVNPVLRVNFPSSIGLNATSVLKVTINPMKARVLV